MEYNKVNIRRYIFFLYNQKILAGSIKMIYKT